MQYMGGKSKKGPIIANKMESILKKNKHIKGYIEPFCGSLGVFRHMTQVMEGKPCYALDGCEDLILLFKKLQENKFKCPEPIDEEKWKKLKYSKKPSALRAFAGFGLSYSGIWFDGYAQKYAPQRDYHGAAYRGLQKIKPFIKDAIFEHRNYKDHLKCIEKGSYLIYCDPPYANTKKQFGSNYDFDINVFWETAKKWASWGNIVVVSETTAPKDPKIKEIATIDIKSTINNGKNNTTYVDKLYIVLK